jgi:hypothetical protein
MAAAVPCVTKAGIEELVQCCMCLEVPPLPWRGCVNGHLLCNSCRQGLDPAQCPQCRAALTTLVPMHLAEQLARECGLVLSIGCAHPGCRGRFMSERERDVHVRTCPAGPIPCAFGRGGGYHKGPSILHGWDAWCKHAEKDHGFQMVAAAQPHGETQRVLFDILLPTKRGVPVHHFCRIPNMAAGIIVESNFRMNESPLHCGSNVLTEQMGDRVNIQFRSTALILYARLVSPVSATTATVTLRVEEPCLLYTGRLVPWPLTLDRPDFLVPHNAQTLAEGVGMRELHTGTYLALRHDVEVMVCLVEVDVSGVSAVPAVPAVPAATASKRPRADDGEGDAQEHEREKRARVEAED